MEKTVTSRGELGQTAGFRKLDNIEAEHELGAEPADRGNDRMLSSPPGEGAVEWLLACPQKDYFQSLESGLTDSLHHGRHVAK